MKKNLAFTLAEVLIVLGVIGIIAEMTIPTLVQNIQDKIAVGMTKKAYSVISQAYISAVQANGTPDNWGLGGMDSVQGSMNLINSLKPYLKYTKTCIGINPSDYQGCAKNTMYKYLGGNDWYNFYQSDYIQKIMLNDGTILMGETFSADCSSTAGTSVTGQTVCASLYVDINGVKEPNKCGVDMFEFFITKTGVIPLGGPDASSWHDFDNHCKNATTDKTTAGWGCTAWVLYNGNMDYLHCNTLSWSGSHTCN